jgi:hypothetical protein
LRWIREAAERLRRSGKTGVGCGQQGGLGTMQEAVAEFAELGFEHLFPRQPQFHGRGITSLMTVAMRLLPAPERASNPNSSARRSNRNRSN